MLTNIEQLAREAVYEMLNEEGFSKQSAISHAMQLADWNRAEAKRRSVDKYYREIARRDEAMWTRAVAILSASK